MTTAIWWIRRDLRLSDNTALSLAIKRHTSVIPLFIVDKRLLESYWASKRRTAFLFDGLRSLNRDIGQLGGRLIIRSGRPEDILPKLVAESGADHLYAERNHSPFAVRRDKAVATCVPLELVGGITALPVGSVLKDKGEPYTVFTPFKRKWLDAWHQSHPPTAMVVDRIETPSGIESDPIPDQLNDFYTALPIAGETHAQVLLQEFVSSRITQYTVNRDTPGINGTSSLSPYLRFGMLSAADATRSAFTVMGSAEPDVDRTGAETWLSELIWREFYINILYHFPHVHERSFRPQYEAIAWHNNETDFETWCEGRTGYPFVDAGMRQLAQTGWMHNRLRMVTASFLVKDLLIDWRWGERWFMNQLIDGDPASNNGGWQWTAGTGTDAAPYFRIFNPVSQGKRYDADGGFILQWVPELRRLPAKYIHEPWKMSLQQQSKFGVMLGEHYPLPIVDHGWARQRTLEAYRAVTA